MTPVDPHITDEQLAVLVDGQLPEDEDRCATEHLAHCRTCMSAYQDLVRQVHAWKQDSSQSAAPMASARDSRLPRMLLAACLPLLVAITAWMIYRGGDESLPPLPEYRQNEVINLITQASHFGMILPGAEISPWMDRDIVRSEQVEPVLIANVKESLGMLEEYSLDPGLEISATLVAGGNDFARIKLDNGLGDQLPPDRYHVLKGVQLWGQEGIQLDDVAKHFRKALELSPGDPLARFNLAYCLWAQNRLDEAGLLFNELASDDDSNLISVRAAASLTRIQAGEPY